VGTISGVTVVYVLASWALVGMIPYSLIDPSSGFSEAFRHNGVTWAAEFVAAGELLTLPLVVLVGFLAQPRLQFAMAEDGLLPKVFSRLDSNGNLFMVRRAGVPAAAACVSRIGLLTFLFPAARQGTLLCGLLCTLISIFISFSFLDDMISAGECLTCCTPTTQPAPRANDLHLMYQPLDLLFPLFTGLLIAFNFTNSALIISRRSNPQSPLMCSYLVLAFNVTAVVACFLW
jgi:amino acid transporter